MTREEAVRFLDWMTKLYPGAEIIIEQEEIDAIKVALTALRDNPCDNCIGPALAISHGYKDMRTKKPVVEG